MEEAYALPGGDAGASQSEGGGSPGSARGKRDYSQAFARLTNKRRRTIAQEIAKHKTTELPPASVEALCKSMKVPPDVISEWMNRVALEIDNPAEAVAESPAVSEPPQPKKVYSSPANVSRRTHYWKKGILRAARNAEEASAGRVHFLAMVYDERTGVTSVKGSGVPEAAQLAAEDIFAKAMEEQLPQLKARAKELARQAAAAAQPDASLSKPAAPRGTRAQQLRAIEARSSYGQEQPKRPRNPGAITSVSQTWSAEETLALSSGQNMNMSPAALRELHKECNSTRSLRAFRAKAARMRKKASKTTRNQEHFDAILAILEDHRKQGNQEGYSWVNIRKSLPEHIAGRFKSVIGMKRFYQRMAQAQSLQY